MVQIFGKIISNKKKVNVALQNISGLNNCQITNLCNELNVGLDCKITDLSQSHIIKLLKLLVPFFTNEEKKLKQANWMNFLMKWW